MSLNHRKRQKKAERRKAKQRKRQLVRRTGDDLVSRLRRVGTAPLLHCHVFEDLFEAGIGMVVLSRKLADGHVAFAVYLLDVYCLGVKDILCDIRPRADYDEWIEKMFDEQPMVKRPPESLRKLVEGAVAYAEDLGFPPPRDYAKARLIFGDIDASASSDVFTFGRHGKPFFVRGPHDSDEKCRRVFEMLTARCGKGNFDLLVGMSPTGGFPGLLVEAEGDLRIGRVIDYSGDEYDDEDWDDDSYAEADEDDNDEDDDDIYDEDDDGDDFDDEEEAVEDESCPSVRRQGVWRTLGGAINPFRRRPRD